MRCWLRLRRALGAGVVTGGLHWSVMAFQARALMPAVLGWGPSGAAGSALVML
jgi:hypothetical protein